MYRGSSQQPYNPARRRILKLGISAGLLTTLPAGKLRAEKARSSARILILGHGAAGITIANRLNKALDQANITLVGAGDTHIYRPGLALVAAGLWDKRRLISHTRDWLTNGINWINQDPLAIDPESRQLILNDGQAIGYDLLVIASDCQLNYHEIEGLRPGLLGTRGICSLYAGPDAAAATRQMLQAYTTQSTGAAIFTLSNTPITEPASPLTLTFTALEQLAQSGRHNELNLSVITPYKGKLFAIRYHNDLIRRRWTEQGVTIQDQKLLSAIDPETKTARFTLPDGDSQTMEYDIIHLVPPMSVPELLRNSSLVWQQGPLAGNWIEVNQFSLQHQRYPEVFALGDAAGIPLGKTTASINRQATVLQNNILAFLSDQPLSAQYDGYTACPLITRTGSAIPIEFGYEGRLMPSLPLLSMKQESWLAWMMISKLWQPAYYAMLQGRV